MVNYPVILFTSVGAVAGLATAIWGLHELSIKTVGTGVLFALALAIAMALARKHLTRPASRLRLSAFLAVVAGSYPIAILGMLAVIVLSRQLNSDPQFNFLSGLLVGTMIAATLMQLALMVLGERWSTGQWIVFLGTGVFASVLALAAHAGFARSPSIAIDPVFWFVLLPLGQAMFAGIFGYTLTRTVGSD